MKPLLKIPWTPVYPFNDDVCLPHLQGNLALLFCDLGHSVFFNQRAEEKKHSRVLENATGAFDQSIYRYFRSIVCCNWRLEGDRARDKYQLMQWNVSSEKYVPQCFAAVSLDLSHGSIQGLLELRKKGRLSFVFLLYFLRYFHFYWHRYLIDEYF